MRPKTLILFFVAIGCGLVASIGVSQYMEKARGSAGLQLETQKIYVAASEINIGDTLDDKNIKLEEWPKDRIPEGAVTELKDLEG
jgi:pilus assembly protein CpaB